MRMRARRIKWDFSLGIHAIEACSETRNIRGGVQPESNRERIILVDKASSPPPFPRRRREVERLIRSSFTLAIAIRPILPTAVYEIFFWIRLSAHPIAIAHQ